MIRFDIRRVMLAVAVTAAGLTRRSRREYPENRNREH
jgi:hypothetical protein